MTATRERSPDLARVVLADPVPTSRAVADLAFATATDAARIVASAVETDWASDAVLPSLVDELDRRSTALAAGGASRDVADPGFYQWYFKLLSAAFDNDQPGVRCALASGPGTDGYATFDSAARSPIPASTTVRLVYQSDVVTRAAADYSAGYTAQYGHEVVIRPLPPDAFQTNGTGAERAARLAAGVEMLQTVWPDGAEALETCTLDVALVVGPYFVGGSDLACFGTTFLDLRTDWSVLCYADHLLHEAAHQAMHAFGELNPPLRNPGFVGLHSPIRPDPRPLYGTLHATIVFSWLVELCLRVMADPPDASTRSEAELRLHRHLLGLNDGVKSLDEHADWTPAGERLRDGLARRVELLAALIGEPDPDLYERTPSDYERPSSIPARRHG